MNFLDRIDAGRQVAAALMEYANRADVVVLGLPRGGVPVAYEVAKALRAPMDVMVVRKIGVPGHQELAMGAVASGNILVRNESVIRDLDIPEEVVESAASDEISELDRRERLYRGIRLQPPIDGKIVILVDDGMATGSTMLAAVRALRQLNPSRVVVAVPVGAREAFTAIRAEADEVVCLAMPTSLVAVGDCYCDFAPTTDEEVKIFLSAALRLIKRTA